MTPVLFGFPCFLRGATPGPLILVIEVNFAVLLGLPLFDLRCTFFRFLVVFTSVGIQVLVFIFRHIGLQCMEQSAGIEPAPTSRQR